MKKALLMVAFLACTVAMNAQNTPAKSQAPAKKESVKAAPAAVKSSSATGTSEVTPAAPAKKATVAAAKEHSCTAECKGGKHAYAHGEKGHTCGDACKKMMKEMKKS